MKKKRVALLVYIDLDPTPGTFHTPLSARAQVQAILNEAIKHYRPDTVLIADLDVYSGSEVVKG